MQGKRKEIQDYLTTNVNVFIQPLVYDIVKKRPSDPAAHAIKWLTDYAAKKDQAKESKNGNDSGSDCSEEHVDCDEEFIERRKNAARKRSRVGISEEVFGDFNKNQSGELRVVPKSQESKFLILGLIKSSILFSNLDEKDENAVIDAMEENTPKDGQTVIKEGQKGDCLYIVGGGQFDCYKNINGQEKYLKTYKKGEAFGELALMYNAPRAATIICKGGEGKIFALDRITFSQIVKGAAMKKRELYQTVISSVELFKDLNSCEKEQFFDVLKEVKYEAGDYVIKQGEFGSEFYLVIEGNLVAEKLEEGDELPRNVYQYRAGDYFGELSLIHDIGRQASIKALSRVRLASIERDTFKRLLGSLEDILKRNEERYAQMQKTISAA